MSTPMVIRTARGCIAVCLRCRQWPEALVARCCAFEPSPAQLATPGCQKLADLMVFPAAHLEAHLEVYMTEFAADVLSGGCSCTLDLAVCF